VLKAAVASSAARLFGRKRLGVVNNGKDVTPGWNQEVKDATQEKKVAYKTGLQYKADSSLDSRYA